jgi:hypothetical protein
MKILMKYHEIFQIYLNFQYFWSGLDETGEKRVRVQD